MLTRYQIIRGRRAPDDPLPVGVRSDTRKHTRSPFRPDADEVAALLEARTDAAFATFARAYRGLLKQRFALDAEPFNAVAEQARGEDVFLGCNCPTDKNPDIRRCHTWLALEFMAERFPDLDVRFPDA